MNTMAFEFDGDEYSKTSAHQKEWGTRLIAELDLRGDEGVLDLGCGDGALTAQLAERVPNGAVLGIDASKGMIESTWKHLRSNLTFELMDINELSFENEFDVVFSNAALHWIKDHRRLLENVHHALKAGGFLRFNFAADGNCSHLYTVVREAMALPEYAAYFENFDWPWYMPDLEEYEALLDQSSFTQREVWGENADRCFRNQEAMIGWVDQPSLVPFLKRINGRDKKRFRDEVVGRMVQATLRADGRCFETFRRINVFAVK
jgi:trans-aconitate 2-methyltransferase